MNTPPCDDYDAECVWCGKDLPDDHDADTHDECGPLLKAKMMKLERIEDAAREAGHAPECAGNQAWGSGHCICSGRGLPDMMGGAG